VLSAEALEFLRLPFRIPTDRIAGIGGLTDSVTIIADLRLRRDDGIWVAFKGEYAACTSYEILEMSVLGRDILNLFALIVHRTARIVTMIGQTHTYTIHQR
jgi:hypothetical protein